MRRREEVKTPVGTVVQVSIIFIIVSIIFIILVIIIIFITRPWPAMVTKF